MNDLSAIVGAIIGIVGTLMGAVLGFLLTLWSDKRARRRRFRDWLAALIVDIEDTSDSELSDFYLSSRHNVRQECAKLRDDICCHRHTRFEACCNEYGDIAKLQNEFAVKVMLSDQRHAPPSDERTKRQKMIDALKKLRESAK